MAYSFQDLEKKVADAREWLQKEYRTLRTGRASPSLLDGIMVSAYGSLMPLKQLASIGVEDARTLKIQPFDVSVLKDIERTIVAANLGVGTIADGAFLRISFPELTGERRAQLVKIAKQKLEEARTTVRMAREESWKEIQALEKEGTMGEDEKFRLKDDLQKRIDAANLELENSFAAKEKEMES
jgi:ribosome recycling factor